MIDLLVQHTLDKIVKLTDEIDKNLLAIDSIIIKTIQRYLNIQDKSPGDPDSAYYTYKITTDNTINGNWEEHWRYGGFDQGWFEFPLNYIYDSSQLDKIEEEKRAKELECEIKKNKIREDLEKQQYEKLKKKFENDTEKEV